MIPAGDTAETARQRPQLPFRSIVVPTLLALGAGALYLPRLQDMPIYVLRDEVFSALTAHSIVSNGHDLNGRYLPLFFQMQMRFGSQMWFQPLLMYAIAFSIKVLPLSEGTIRLPMALAGIADVVLMYFVARHMFRSEQLAVAAAVLLALTPAHFIHSRMAMDFQAPLPFILAWLLCVQRYVETSKHRFLLAAGLALGLGLYSYIAAYVLMPIYAALTCVVLYRRRERLNSYWILGIGLALPALACVPFLLTHPTVVRDVIWHYKRDEAQTLGALGMLRVFISYGRFSDALSLYATFWNPRFLFVNGPRGLWPVGVFLVPVAGLVPIGIARAVGEPFPNGILLIGGLVSAPIAASLVDEPEAIRRALAVLPFVVLLAIGGFQYLRAADSTQNGRIAFAALWGTLILVGAAYHDVLPRAQAYVRIATLPIVVAGLAVLLRHFALRRSDYFPAAIVACATAAGMHVAYFIVDYSIAVGVALGVLIALATLLPGTADRFIRKPMASVALLTLVCCDFIYVYVGYPAVHRLAFIPASVMLLTARFVLSLGALSVVLAITTALDKTALDWDRRRLASLASLALVCGLAAYFAIDYFTNFAFRFVQATFVLTAVVGAAVLLKSVATGRLRFGRIALVSLLIASIQFAYFYADYFTSFRRFGSGESEGNVRIAWNAAVDRDARRPAPAFYLGKIGPYGFGDLFWTFNVIRDNRRDILARTIPDLEFNADRIRTLPVGAIVITSPSSEIDRAIDRMVETGALGERTLLKAPDGTPVYWVLERTAR